MGMNTVNHLVDPFRYCEENCNHDLARGVSVRELLRSDGPHPAARMAIAIGGTRALILPEDGVPDAA